MVRRESWQGGRFRLVGWWDGKKGVCTEGVDGKDVSVGWYVSCSFP